MPVWIVLGVCAAVFVLVVAFAGSRGVFDGGMSDEEADVPPAQRLPDDASPDQIAAVRFTPALWGYRPAEVDDAIARLQARIAVQDVQLAELGRDRATDPGTTDTSAAQPGAVPAQPGAAASVSGHDPGHTGPAPSATPTNP